MAHPGPAARTRCRLPAGLGAALLLVVLGAPAGTSAKATRAPATGLSSARLSSAGLSSACPAGSVDVDTTGPASRVCVRAGVPDPATLSAPAECASVVRTEAELRQAWADPERTSIVLGDDLVLRACATGDPRRESSTPITVDGRGPLPTGSSASPPRRRAAG